MSTNNTFFFFGETKIETNLFSLTGAQIKALIPNFDNTHALVLEGNGNNPDETIADDKTVSFDKNLGTRHFYSVPPATFG